MQLAQYPKWAGQGTGWTKSPNNLDVEKWEARPNKPSGGVRKKNTNIKYSFKNRPKSPSSANFRGIKKSPCLQKEAKGR